MDNELRNEIWDIIRQLDMLQLKDKSQATPVVWEALIKIGSQLASLIR